MTKQLTQRNPHLLLVLLLGFTSSILADSAFATVVFQEDFESELVQWSGFGVRGLPPSGIIVIDPLDPTSSNHVLAFSTTTWGGDLLTIDSFSLSPGTSFRVSYDFLGTCGHSDCGGLIGIAESNPPGPDHRWLAGSNGNDPDAPAVFPDTGYWQRATVPFTIPSGTVAHLMLEDFVYSAAAAPGDAFFDNIRLEVIPEPSTALLLGIGLIGLAIQRRV